MVKWWKDPGGLGEEKDKPPTHRDTEEEVRPGDEMRDVADDEDPAEDDLPDRGIDE